MTFFVEFLTISDEIRRPKRGMLISNNYKELMIILVLNQQTVSCLSESDSGECPRAVQHKHSIYQCDVQQCETLFGRFTKRYYETAPHASQATKFLVGYFNHSKCDNIQTAYLQYMYSIIVFDSAQLPCQLFPFLLSFGLDPIFRFSSAISSGDADQD